MSLGNTFGVKPGREELGLVGGAARAGLEQCARRVVLPVYF